MFGYLFVCLFSCAAQHVGSRFLDQGSNLCCLQWKCRVLATGPPGNPLIIASKDRKEKGKMVRRRMDWAGKWQGRIRWSSLDNQAQRKRNPELILSRYSPSRKELDYIESQLGAWVPHQLLLLLFPGREWIFVGYCVRVKKKRKSLLAIAQAMELVFLFRLFWKLDFQGWWENERAALGTFVYQGGELDFTLKTLQV